MNKHSSTSPQMPRTNIKAQSFKIIYHRAQYYFVQHLLNIYSRLFRLECRLLKMLLRKSSFLRESLVALALKLYNIDWYKDLLKKILLTLQT